jgi:hypothetical protein
VSARRRLTCLPSGGWQPCPTVCFCPAVCACQTSASAQPSASARPTSISVAGDLVRRRSIWGIPIPLSRTRSETAAIAHTLRTRAYPHSGRGRHRSRPPSAAVAIAPSHGSAAPPYPSAANRHSATPSPTRPHRPSFSRSRTHRPTLPAGRQRTTPLGIPSLHPAAPFPRLSLITAAIPSPFGLGAAEPTSAHHHWARKLKSHAAPSAAVKQASDRDPARRGEPPTRPTVPAHPGLLSSGGPAAVRSVPSIPV